MSVPVRLKGEEAAVPTEQRASLLMVTNALNIDGP